MSSKQSTNPSTGHKRTAHAVSDASDTETPITPNRPARPTCISSSEHKRVTKTIVEGKIRIRERMNIAMKHARGGDDEVCITRVVAPKKVRRPDRVHKFIGTTRRQLHMHLFDSESEGEDTIDPDYTPDSDDFKVMFQHYSESEDEDDSRHVNPPMSYLNR